MSTIHVQVLCRPKHGHEDTNIISVKRGADSLLIEAEIMEKGIATLWKSSMRAAADVHLVVINLQRLMKYVQKHPDLELDIYACKLLFSHACTAFCWIR